MIWRNKKRRVQLDLSGADTSSHLETVNVSEFEEQIMKKTFAIAALAAITATIGFANSASAAPFQGNSVNARQAQLEERIRLGQRMGRLNFGEVRSLRNQMQTISFLEARYRRGGLSFAERADLDRRLDRVSFELQRDMRR